MIIEEPYFKLTPIDGTLFDLELLRVINKGKKTERKEFKPEAYGVTYEKQQVRVNSSVSVNFDDSQLRKYQAKLSELEDALIDAESEEEETSLSKKIAKVQEAINRQYDMMKRAGISFNTTQADEAQA